MADAANRADDTRGDYAADLHLPPGHVWSSDAPNDPIQFAGTRSAPVVGALLGPAGLVAGEVVFAADPDELRFGTDPNSPGFGANHFHSDPGSGVTHAHSEYWNKGRSSRNNIGYIVAGQPGRVTR